MRLPETLIFVVLFLADKAGTNYVKTVLGRVSLCNDKNMTELRNNSFLAVTRRGFVRVPMRGRSLQQMNDLVDSVLKQDDEKYPDVKSDPTLIRIFYVNKTTRLFDMRENQFFHAL
uniref:Doublecortin domain-containing protein n=1 Tax=Steinernema glaseri TaxID=37863 RepID=A0A1I8A5X5_9BILA